MYALAAGMGADRMLQLTKAAFREMLRGGCTAVGEFHYFHHSTGRSDHAFDELIIRAAREVGIRLVLLNTFYAHAHVNAASSAAASASGDGASLDPDLSETQRRFATPSVGAFFERIDRLRARSAESPHTQGVAGGGDATCKATGASSLTGTTTGRAWGGAGYTVGIAAHSVRAASMLECDELATGALQRGIVMHMHLEEQPREIADCQAATGCTPLELIDGVASKLGPLFTAVHCTHSTAEDLDRFVAHGANICICPLTEGCLADGLPRLRECGTHICLGSDCNARICLAEEMRWLEYGQRVKHGRRGAVVAASSQQCSDAAAALFRAATVGGAAALGLRAGRIQAGFEADFCLLDLAAPALAPVLRSCDADGTALSDCVLPAFVFGCDAASVVCGVCVGGRWRRWGSSLRRYDGRDAGAPAPQAQAAVSGTGTRSHARSVLSGVALGLGLSVLVRMLLSPTEKPTASE